MRFIFWVSVSFLAFTGAAVRETANDNLDPAQWSKRSNQEMEFFYRDMVTDPECFQNATLWRNLTEYYHLDFYCTDRKPKKISKRLYGRLKKHFGRIQEVRTKTKNHRLNPANRKLMRAHLANTCLADIDLSYADLRNADLKNSDLKNAKFTRALLIGADFTNASLKNADFRDAQLGHTDFSFAKLKRANFSGAHLINATYRFENSEEYYPVSRVFLKHCQATFDEDTVFPRKSEKYIPSALLRPELEPKIKKNPRNHGIPVLRRSLVQANFKGDNLSHLQGNGGQFIRSNFENAILTQANLCRADLASSNFKSADLRGADLSLTDMIGADFSGADLRFCYYYDNRKGKHFSVDPAYLKQKQAFFNQGTLFSPHKEINFPVHLPN